MLQVAKWLDAHNLHPEPLSKGERLEGVALRYALITFLRRPRELPADIVVVLVEDYLAGVVYVTPGQTH